MAKLRETAIQLNETVSHVASLRASFRFISVEIHHACKPLKRYLSTSSAIQLPEQKVGA